MRRRQCRIPTINHGRETALPSPLYHSGVAGIDITSVKSVTESVAELPSAIMRGCTQKNSNLEGNMSRKCQLTGKKANNGFAVSHSHHRTHKLQEANLQWKRIWWPQEKRWVRLHLSTKAIKTLQHKGLEIMAKEAGINLYKM
jgi:large subunit ribosomal protein L28